jgi:hypothetical protein
MARRFSIVLAVVLAIFAVSPNLGHAQGRGFGFRGGGLAFGVAAGAGQAGVGAGAGPSAGGARVPVGAGVLVGAGAEALVGAGAEAGFGSRDGADLALEPLRFPRYQHKVPKQRGVNTNG